MGMCWVPDCNHHSAKDTCNFYRIPKYPGVKEAWTAAIGRNVEPNKDSRVCSCHFVDGNKHSLPCIFKRNADEAHQHLWKEPKTVTRKPARAYSSTSIPVNSAQAITTISTPVRLNPEVVPYFIPGNMRVTSIVQRCSCSDGRNLQSAPTHRDTQPALKTLSRVRNSQDQAQQPEGKFLEEIENQNLDPELPVKTEIQIPDPAFLVETEYEASEPAFSIKTEDHIPQPASFVKTEDATSEIPVECPIKTEDNMFGPQFSLKTEHQTTEPALSMKMEDHFPKLAFSVKIEDQTTKPALIVTPKTEPSEPELIIPDIIPNPFKSSEQELAADEEPPSKKVRVATWSRTWFSD